MDPAVTASGEAFPHIRIIMGMVIGLGLTRLLTGVARMLQHPGQVPIYPVHLAWVGSVMLMLVHFWWWQFGLYGIAEWTFEKYLFVISYAVLLFLLCAFLFPDSMADYSGYEDFFLARRRSFFSLLATTYLFDVIDTLIKGEAHFARFGGEYLVRTPILVALCIVGATTRNHRFHAVLVVSILIYQVSWILRLFDTIG